MSVLIKGMDKETAVRICAYTGVRMDDNDFVPVPPHGRLIDADALIDSFDPSDFWNSDAEDNCFAAVHVVNSAPTIIPAESPKEKT